MLKEERQNIILEIINVRNKVRSTELSTYLNVSEDTIRRDLRELAEGGFIKKVHGGALANPKTPEMIHYQGHEPSPEMKSIALKVRPLLQENQVIIMEGGLINEHLATLLDDRLNLTVFTNAVGVADLLAEWPGIDTYLLGGKLAGRERITCGPDTMAMLQDIRADLAFLHLRSLHHELGLMSKQREVALTRRTMINSARQTVGLCLSEHLSRIQPFRIAEAKALHVLATDLDPDGKELHHFRAKGISVL